MIAIVREHNVLTGYRFVIAEYGLVAAALGLLVAWYVAAGRIIEALAWFGIVANCLVVAALAVDDLRHGAPDLGLLPMRRRSFREAVARGHPHLARRTLVLIAVSLVPYLLAAAAAGRAIASLRAESVVIDRGRPGRPGPSATRPDRVIRLLRRLGRPSMLRP